MALLTACSEIPSKQSLEEKYVLSDSKFVELRGNRVHYTDEGQGETVILLHGTASSLHTWNQWAQKLKQQYRVVRLDLTGSGLTGPDVEDRYEIPDDVALLEALIQSLNLNAFHLAGSSLGGRIAWAYSLEHPEKVKTLTLINSLGYPQESWPPAIELAQWPVLDTLFGSISPRPVFAQSLTDIYYDRTLINDELIDRYHELANYPGNLAAFPKRVKARLDQDSDLIPQIKVPTLILWGEEDLYFPVSAAHRFHQDIERSELYIYPNVGHLPMEEVADQSRRDFESFIAKH